MLFVNNFLIKIIKKLIKNIDFIIDEEGYIKFLVVGISSSKFSFFGSKEYVEIPWECVTKVGTNVIVISAEEGKIKRARA